MGTTKVGNNTDAPVRPTYEQLLDENRALKRQVEWLTRLVEKLRRQERRQAAPFRRQDETSGKAKKPVASRAGAMGGTRIAAFRRGSTKATTCRCQNNARTAATAASMKPTSRCSIRPRFRAR